MERARLKCLIVDDSAFMRFHLRRMMECFENVIASEAANGIEALKEYSRVKPDIVLMDIVMPGLEGVETVRKLREADNAAKVIMVSSVTCRDKIEEAMAAGAMCFISKPVTTEALQGAIDSVLSAQDLGMGA